jgi:hypothetical protein
MKPAWSPQLGPQTEAISATWCHELFFGGARGGGKSDYLLGDYLQDVNKYGENWQGILFRRTYPELKALIERSQAIYPATGAKWYEADKEWWWPNGAGLRMRYLERYADTMNYQGHQYPWMGFDELTNWPDDQAYLALQACNRWVPCPIPTKRIRCSGNPGGPGHQWVKDRFVDINRLGHTPFQDPETLKWRMFIPSKVQDNKLLLQNDPYYINTLRGVGSAALVKAWLDGDWDIVAGAYFTEFGAQHIVDPCYIPANWVRFGSFDWGSAKPFSFGWWAVSDGELRQFPKGAIVRYREWYGAAGPNSGLKLHVPDVAKGIVERSLGDKLAYSVADPSIWKEDGGPSIFEQMRLRGVNFRPADNSRIAGWESLRARLVGEDDRPMIYFFSSCKDSIRTLPALQHDENNPEDIDTDGEDHAADDIRYACMSRPYTRPRLPPKVVKTIANLTTSDLVPVSGGNSGRI